ATPASRMSRITRNSSPTSSASRLEVGSSRMRTAASRSTALAMATSCWTASGWPPSTESGSTARLRRASSSAARRRTARRSTRPSLRGSRPSRMFSATVRLGQRFTSWYTVAIPASWAAPGEANTRSSPRTRMVPPSMPYTPVSALIKVDFPAPFSPMSACTSPGRSRKPTPASALTPGKPTVMSRISTTGDVVIGPPCTTQRTSQPGQMGHDGDGRHRPRREHLGSVLALRERGLRRSLVERGLLGEHPGRHSLAVLDLLGEVHELWAEQRAALDDKVDLAVGQRLHAVLHRVDGDDLDVLAGHLARRLDGLDGAETHVVVLRVDHIDLRLRLQEGLHHLLAA